MSFDSFFQNKIKEVFFGDILGSGRLNNKKILKTSDHHYLELEWEAQKENLSQNHRCHPSKDDIFNWPLGIWFVNWVASDYEHMKIIHVNELQVPP